MKRFLLFASALAGLFLAGSCQQETLEPVGGNAVTFTVLAPGQFDTKAKIADGENVNEVLYEIYKTKDGHANSLNGGEYLAKGSVKMENKKATVTFDLLQDQEYTVIFWAQVAGKNHYNTSDLRLVSIAGDPSTLNANVEDRAAFYRVYEFETPLTEPKEVKLYRPFSQINLGTTLASLTPIQPGQTEGYEIDVQESSLHVKGLSKAYNTVEHKAEGTAEYLTEYTFASKPTPYKQNNKEKLEVNGVEYHYVGMNYVFVPENEKLVELDYTITTDKGLMAHDIINVPLKKNYRTNIVGNLLTKDVTFEIVVDENFDGDYIGPEFVEKPAKNDAGEWVIETPYELAWLAAAVNGTLPEEDTKAVPAAKTFEGETFILNNDIDLANFKNWTPIGATGKFLGTFDGQDHTISNLTVEVSGKASAGLFANCRNVKNVNMSNVKIKGQYKAGAITGDALCAKIENCHVDGLEMVVTPYMENDANNVGGIAGYLSAEPEAYIKGCSVTNATITAYRKVGGIVGAANRKSEVSGNTVSEITVIADQTSVYNEVKAADAGAVVGYAHADAVVTTTNTVGDEVVVDRKVDTTKELEFAVAEAESGATIYIGNGEVALPHFESKALYFKGIHADAAILEPVSSHIDAFWQGAELNFTDLKIKGTSYTGKANGYVKSAKETYTNCAFVDGYYMFAGDEAIVNDCVFTGKYNSYFWTGSADAITFNECKFNGVERIVKVCTVGHTGVERKVTFNDCQFTASEQYKAAIEIDGTKGSSYDVKINNCTETGFAAGKNTGISLFNIEGTDNVVLYVNGNKYVAEGLLEGEDGSKVAYTEAGLKDVLENGGTVVLANPFTIDQSESNGYGKTGINMINGGVLDGNGNELGAPGSTGTWDSAINTSGGTIKNIKVTKGFRGIFIKNSSHNEKLYLDNVTIEGTTYTISCDQGNGLGLEATNSTFKGWTSFAGTLGNAKFTDCYFGYGNGYSFCRPYAPTEFIGCEFEAGYKIDPRAAVTFENCTFNGVALTSANVSDLVTSTEKVTVK